LENNDCYKTLAKPSPETLFKEKGSKFFGYAIPISEEKEVAAFIDTLKTKHKNARHFCYAFQLGEESFYYRANDDGEPSGSAGTPIYGQIQSFEITNVLIVVVRYFGGTKLGVGGLISAYKESAKITLEAAEVIEKTIDKKFHIVFNYKDMNKVMRLIKEHQINIESQQMEMDCKMFLSIRKSNWPKVQQSFEELYEVHLELNG
jgi:uncharacterized YigZ family protein